MSQSIIDGKDIYKYQISTIEKQQTNTDNLNLFFKPNISLTFYNALVSFVKPNSITLKWNKGHHLTLFFLLRKINETLKNLIPHQYHNRLYNLYTEYTDLEHFTLQISIPSNHSKIKTNDSQPFCMPSFGNVLPSVTVHIKNVWVYPNKAGFNIQLYSISY